MSRTKHPSILLATLLAAAILPAAVQGQDATPSGSQPGSPSSPAASAGAPIQRPVAGSGPAASTTGSPPDTGTGLPAATGSGAGTGTDRGTAPATGAAPATPSAPNGRGTDKTPPVCFKLTGRCVDAGSAPKAQNSSPTLQHVDPQQRGRLNLSAPDVRTVIPADQLREPLPTGEQIAEVQESETVAVKATSEAPDVPGGFGAIWWALNHPSQAWRIFTPVE